MFLNEGCEPVLFFRDHFYVCPRDPETGKINPRF
ncbi:Hypothetical protein Minf_2311 [Methylacidiphilum infernorum V4]|uniref:Uncharacterized protein n=1 Tax=Methylacidiphilum infernorum (isolate V4) TaxID=481448 RepID=B3E0D6_METI4|nr:Hypothetical protein Minf_2311 [Methylacidiphilum infernorum V4]